MGKILRWLPAVLLMIAFGLLWKQAASGGEQGVLAWLLLMGGLPFLGGIVLLAVVILGLWKRQMTWVSTATIAAALLTIWPYFWRFGVLPMAYPVSIDKMTPSVSVRLPLNEPALVAWGGDTPHVNYHVTFPDARWAYDLVVEPAFIENDNLTDYGCWGVDVVAPANSEVIIVHDGEEDVTIGAERVEGSPHQGNHIFLQLDGGTYLAIGHLQKDSIVVNEGDFVQEGDLLGKCGNSGSSSEPHIHIHHQKDDPRFNTELAEGLPLFFRDHTGDPMPEGGKGALGPIVEHVGQ